MVEVSYIAYKTMTVKAGNGPLNVTLEHDNQALSEVVVVGFGTQKKVNLTGTVSVIDSKSFRPIAGNRHLHRYYNFTELMVETASG